MMMQEDLHPAMLTVAERMIEKVFEEGPGSAQTPGKYSKYKHILEVSFCFVFVCGLY